MKKCSRILIFAALASILVAMLELRIVPVSAGSQRIYLVDMSGSARPYVEPVLTSILAAAKLDESDPHIVAFGDRAVVIDREDPESFENYRLMLDLGRNSTNLQDAIAKAGAVARRDRGIEVLLFSDGNFDGAAADIAGAFRRLPAKVFCVLPAPTDAPDAMILDAALHRYFAGISVLTAKVRLTSNTRFTLSLKRAGDVLLSREYNGKAGVNVVSDIVAGASPGLIGFITPLDYTDQIIENNGFAVSVPSNSASVRVIAVSSDAASSAMIKSALPDCEISGSFAPEIGVGVILLDNCDLSKFAVEKAAELKDMVYNGTGLVILGGDSAHKPLDSGLGIDRMLPYTPGRKERKDYIILIDKSGSMDSTFKGKKKKDWVAGLMKEIKEVSADGSVATVINFDEKAYLLWKDVEIASMKEDEAVMPSYGATSLLNALDFVRTLYSASDLAGRRMIIVSDMQSAEKPEEIKAVVSGLPCDVIVFLTDEPTGISKALSGPSNVFIREVGDTLGVAGDLTFDKPRKVTFLDEAVSAGVNGLSVTHLNGLTPKKTSRLLAVAGAEPLILCGSYGAGRVVACSFALAEGWSSQDESMRALLRNLVGFAAGSSDRFEIEYEPLFTGGARLTAWSGSPLPDDVTDIEAVSEDIGSIRFRRTGFNRLEAVVAERIDHDVSFTILGKPALLRVPYPAEYTRTSLNRAMLEGIASATGGAVLSMGELPGLLTRPAFTFESSPNTFVAAAAIAVFLAALIEFFGLRRP